MDELEKRQAMLPLEMIPRGGTQALEAQQIVDVSSEEVPHLLDYWAIIKKRRWVVLSCLVIVFATVAIGTLKEKPVYEGKVLIEIDPEPPNVVNFKEVVSVSPVDVRPTFRPNSRFLRVGVWLSASSKTCSSIAYLNFIELVTSSGCIPPIPKLILPLQILIRTQMLTTTGTVFHMCKIQLT